MLNTNRQGIALVLSMIILVMMLMLALPFALSQNASIKSSDQFAITQDTTNARESLEALGLGIAANSFSTNWDPANNKHHHALLGDSIKVLDPAGGVLAITPDPDPTQVDVRMEHANYPLRVHYSIKAIREKIWMHLNQTGMDLELVIEDESGKIDINALSSTQWTQLLTLVGITYNNSQLAGGFVSYRLGALDGKPWTSLDQLLLASPTGVDPRPKLTHAELERLRPYVTAHGMGQGIDGYQEIGNVIVETNPSPPGNKYTSFDVHPSQTIFANNTFKVYGDGSNLTTNYNSIGDYAAALTPIGQSLNINTASKVALQFIKLFPDPSFDADYDTHLVDTLTTPSGRKVFKLPEELPNVIRDRIYRIDDKDTSNTGDDLEQIPISLDSSGVASVRTRAQGNNRSNRPASESIRNIIAMCISGKDVLEKTWDNQLAMQMNIASRYSSLLTSWPRAIERKGDEIKDTTPNQPVESQWQSLASDPTDTSNAAFKPIPLPDMHYADLFPLGGWTKLFTRYNEDIPSNFDINDDVTPEGILSKNAGGDSLVYDQEKTVNGQKTSFAEPHFQAGGDPQQMEARQISFWLTTPNKADFDANWVDRTVPIFEIRAPEENTGLPIDPSGPNDGHSLVGAPTDNAPTMDYRKDNGDNSKQHYLAMYYDGTTDVEHFVLRVAGEIIEIPTAAFGAPFHPQNSNTIVDPTDPTRFLDDRTLGGGTHPLTNPQHMTWSEHRYIQKLQPDRAYDVKIILQNTKPGGMHIIIDGLVGRDLTKLSNPNISEILPGDHYTTPYPLKLSGALPQITQSMAHGNKVADEALRNVGNISARGLSLPSPWDGILASPSDWLPDNTNGLAHGMMNVNGEFIAYKNWTESGGVYTFAECKRGCRQLVNDQDELGVGANRVHRGYAFTIPPEPGLGANTHRRNMPAHLNNSEVWPGGLSFERDTKLYRGGCVLMTPMGDNTRKRAASNQGLAIGATSITVVDTSVLADFPDYGLIKVEGRGTVDSWPPAGYLGLTWDDDADPMTPEVPTVAGDGVPDDVVEIMYFTKTATGFNVVRGFKPSSFGPEVEFTVPDPSEPGDHLRILLVSWQVEKDPTQGDRYRDPGDATPNTIEQGYDGHSAPTAAAATVTPTGQIDAPTRSFSNWIPESRLQLYDVTNTDPTTYGAIEWIEYTDVESIPAAISNTGTVEHYFLNRNGGYGGGRGQLGTHYDPARIWPVGTRILPVQTAGKFGYLMEAGDIVTLSAKQLGVADVSYRFSGGENTRKFSTWQTVIRYASQNTRDGYHWNGSGASWGPTFHYPKDIKFAFTEELPEFPNNALVSIWPSWSNEDLTFYNLTNISPNQFNASNFPFVNAWADNYADNNSRKLYMGTQDVSRLPTDPLWVNNMPGVINNAECTFDSISGITPLSGKDYQIPTVISASSGTDIGDTIRITAGPGFSGNRRDRTGLVLIEGEVLAYQISDPPSGAERELLIIGNSLLGSERMTVSSSNLIGSEVLRLPYGPVGRLNDDLAPDHNGIVDLIDINGFGNDTNILNKAHSFLIVDPRDGNHTHEMVQLIPQSGRYHTAPWLRGMYNTPVQDWDSSDDPIVIAWTPRFGSALPKDQSHLTDENLRSALLRSRSFAWAGAPLRLFGMKLDGSSTPSAEVLLGHNTDVPFDFEIRALDSGYNWASTDTHLSTHSAPNVDDMPLTLPTVFNEVWEPEGGDFEMRVHWRYAKDPYDPSDEPYQQIQAIAEASNRSPSIKSIKLKADAHTHILDAVSHK